MGCKEGILKGHVCQPKTAGIALTYSGVYASFWSSNWATEHWMYPLNSHCIFTLNILSLPIQPLLLLESECTHCLKSPRLLINSVLWLYYSVKTVSPRNLA